MQDGSAHKETILACYQGMFEQTDITQYCTDDLVIDEAPDLVYGGVFRGKKALLEAYQKLSSTIDVSDFKVVKILSEDDTAIALLEFRVAMPDGFREICRVAEVFEFRDGRICFIRPFYFDTSVVNRAAMSRPPSAASEAGAAT